MAFVYEQIRQDTLVVCVYNVGGFSSVPMLHVGVLWMDRDVVTDGALPVVSGEVRQLARCG
jgi:hypothetical protein